METPVRVTHFKDLKLILIGIPVVAAIGLLLFGTKYIQENELTLLISIISSILTTTIIWLGVRRIVIYLWDKHPWELNPLRHLVIEVFSILGYTAFAGTLISGLWYIFKPEIVDFDRFGINFLFTLLITFFITSLHEGWFFFQQWKKTLVKSEKLAKENIHSQFDTLKSQISPHFLFNSMNTLVNLIEEDQKLAVEYVQRSADYYRNILNLKDKDVIPLADELRLIEDYYFLQKKRFGDNLTLKLNIPGELETTVVAPLAIQMLFENAVKHNIISRDKPLNISISSENDFIVVENNLQPREKDADSNGIGLQNIANRYRYLSSREVNVTSSTDRFEVRVPVLRMQPDQF
ncbi:MAG: sensor histidine kinase [Bacteroidales bacterium]